MEESSDEGMPPLEKMDAAGNVESVMGAASSDSAAPHAPALIGPPPPPAGTVLRRVGRAKKESQREGERKQSATSSSGTPSAMPDLKKDADFDAVDDHSGGTVQSGGAEESAVNAGGDGKKQQKKKRIGPARPPVKKNPPPPASVDGSAAAAAARKEEWEPPKGPTEKGLKNIQENLARDLKDFPLFMDTLPENPDEHEDLSAIQQLLEEGTPEERAENFKKHGNKALARGFKGWDDAIMFYTRAIGVGNPNKEQMSIYHSNRAAVQLLKKNWGKAVADCKESLKYNEGNVKAAYRASKALYELRKLPEALKYLRMAMKQAKTKQMVELEKDIARLMRKQRVKEEKKNATLEELAEKMMEINRVIKKRGYKWSTDDVYGVTPKMEEVNAEVQLAKPNNLARNPTERELWTPVVLLYPVSHQSDFIGRASEKNFVRDLLSLVMGPGRPPMAWDDKGHYVNSEIRNMVVYVKTNDVYGTYKKQKFVKVRLSNTLQEVLTCDPELIVPKVPVLYVVHLDWKEQFFSPQVQEMWGTPASRPDGE